MSTGYTVNADTWQDITWDINPGQTFRVPEEVDLHYIMVYVHKPHPSNAIRILIHRSDAHHKPKGDVLAVAVITSTNLPPDVDEGWVTKQLSSPVNALPEEYFAITMEPTDIWKQEAKWAYDKGDAAYPAGLRILSTNRGVDWTSFFDDDHLFYIWGTPPALPPPPAPPVDKWAPIDITQLLTADGYKITFTTDSPCHLFLLHTDKQPRTHRTAKSYRGDLETWDAYFCFVAWQTIEQQEPGDTTNHTFYITGLVKCNKIWFRFHGTVKEQTCPCDSPIFHKHYTGPPSTLYFYSDPAPAVTACDGWVTRKNGAQPWAEIREYGGTHAYNFSTNEYTIINTDYGSNKYWRLTRFFMLFDTTPLPANATIISAEVGLYIFGQSTQPEWAPAWAVVDSFPLFNTILKPEDYIRQGTRPLSNILQYHDLQGYGNDIFTLNQLGINAINKGGITKLGIREFNYDCRDIEPDPRSRQSMYIEFYSTDKGDPYRPYLKVTFKVPD